MGIVAAEASPEEIWNSLRSKLWEHRRVIIHLLRVWKYQSLMAKEHKCKPYLDLLFKCGVSGYQIHKDRRDVEIDLVKLKKLHTQFEDDIVKGKRFLFRHQISVIYAYKKIGLLLCDLDRISKGEGTIFPDADFRDWIAEKLCNEDWKDYLKFAYANETDVLYRAAAERIKLEKQTITPENIRVQDAYEVKSRLKMYYQELENVQHCQRGSVDSISHGQYQCKLIKEIMSQLSFRHIVKPVYDIKEERRDGVDSAELTVHGSTGLKNGKMELVAAVELPKDKKMESVAAEKSPEEIWKSLWSRLSTLRFKLKQILGYKDWDIMPFPAKEQLFQPYLNLLFQIGQSGYQIHKDRGGANVDFEILQELHAQLECDIVEGKRNFFRRQIAVIYAYKKIGMLLCDLDRILKGEGTIFPDADFRDWIVEKLRNEDWEDYLKFADAGEINVMYRAAAEGVELEKQTITPENIRVQDEDEVKSRLTVYHKELEAAQNMEQKNVDCIGRGPDWCKLIKEIMSQQNFKCLVKPDDDTREERRDGVDNAKLTERSWLGRKNRAKGVQFGLASMVSKKRRFV